MLYMALHLIVVTVSVAPASWYALTQTQPVIWAAGFRIPATSAQHDDYSTKSEGITVNEVLAMASTHLLPGDTV